MDSQTQITLPDGRLATVRVRSPESYLANPHNTNRGTERGNSALIESMRQSGLHRGIVVSNDGTVVNGNHAYQTASELGVATAWVEIEVEGDVGIVTRRVDWDTAQNPKAIAAALADNRTNELNFDIDPVEFAEAIAALNQVGDELPGALFSDDEISEILAGIKEPTEEDWGDAFGRLPDGDRAPFQKMAFTLHDEQAEQVKGALEAAKRMGKFDSKNQNSNGNALARICEIFLTNHGDS